MKETTTVNDQASFKQLEKARSLHLPSRQEMLQRAPSVQYFGITTKSY